MFRFLIRREVETTIKSVSDDFEETTTRDNYHMIDSDDDPTLTIDLLDTLAEDEGDGGYDGLANTEINCHKCLRASFNFKKVNFCVHSVLFHFSFSKINFCSKCEEHGMFKKENMLPDNCNKCTRPKYHKKHPNYCETRCNVILADTDEDKTTSSKTKAKKTFWDFGTDLGPLGNLFRASVLAYTLASPYY